jgi:hypothetical protein
VQAGVSRPWEELLAQAISAAQSHPLETDLLLAFKRRRSPPKVLAARLRPAPMQPQASSLPLGLGEGSGSYLVTGGLGGVGSAVVDWLIDAQHVRPERIVICTRRQVGAGHRRGAKVVTVDVGDRRALLGCEELRSLADVAGIFHLAGVLDDGVLRYTN